MANDFVSTLFVVFSFALTFILARMLSRKWREKKARRELEQRRANESRQVRRARERRTGK